MLPDAECGRATCMCLECLCCPGMGWTVPDLPLNWSPGLAISATRFHLMIEYNLVPDPSDNQIIR